MDINLKGKDALLQIFIKAKNKTVYTKVCELLTVLHLKLTNQSPEKKKTIKI